MKAPEIAIVVPAYNAARYLTQTLESVCAQTIAAWELVVIDDGSTDETLAIAADYAARDARITVHRQTHSGVAAARNLGLSAADRRAWAIMFLDADDVLEPDALDTLVTCLRAHPSAVGAHGQVRFIASDGRPIRPGEAEAWGRERRAFVNGRIVDWPVECPTTLAVLILLCRMRTPGCVLLRRELVQLVDGFDTDPKAATAEDYELWLQLARRGEFIFVDQVVLSYRLHEHNSSGNIGKHDARVRYVLRKFARSQDIAGEQRQLIRRGLRYSRLLGSQFWFAWARTSIGQGHVVLAAKQGRHAVVEFLHFCLDRSV
jgi:glycosyltransferase involved in cell wall biosynthesis